MLGSDLRPSPKVPLAHLYGWGVSDVSTGELPLTLVELKGEGPLPRTTNPLRWVERSFPWVAKQKHQQWLPVLQVEAVGANNQDGVCSICVSHSLHSAPQKKDLRYTVQTMAAARRPLLLCGRWHRRPTHSV